MLRIIESREFKSLPQRLRFGCSKFDEIRLRFLWTPGMWLEYWENSVINFKFHLFQGIVTVYENEFTRSYSDDVLKTFLEDCLRIEELFDYIRGEVDLEIIEILPRDDPKLEKLWKYDYKLYISDESFYPEFFRNHWKVRLNSKEIRSFPYLYGGVKLYSPDDMNEDEKDYWFNLFLTKIYVNGKDQRSNQECK